MNWLWINIPLMAVFFLAITGIPLWLVVRHPDRGPVASNTGFAPEERSWAQQQTVAARYAASRAETAPLAAIRLAVAGGDDELVVPTLSQARR